MPVSVLFVCMGNICRSPSAEAVFLAKIQSDGLSSEITCDSAGTIGYHNGARPDSRMRAAAAMRGYSLEGISRQVRPEDFDRFDYIIAMDDDNYGHLQAMQSRNGGKARLRRMCDFGNHGATEVPDPYYGGHKGFERVLDIIEEACEDLLEEIRAETARSRRG